MSAITTSYDACVISLTEGGTLVVIIVDADGSMVRSPSIFVTRSVAEPEIPSAKALILSLDGLRAQMKCD